MRFVLNQVCLAQRRWSGVSQYTAELGKGLARLAPDEMCVFPPPWLRGALSAWGNVREWLPRRAGSVSAAPSAAREPKITPPFRPSLKHRFLQRSFERFCHRHDVRLYHEPNFLIFESDTPTVATIHDLSVVAHPEWHPAERCRDYERRFQTNLDRCAHFLTVSDFTRNELIRTLGVAPARVTRTYNGVRNTIRPMPADHVRATLRRLKLPPRYLLHVGTIEPRKNLLMLMQVYSSLPANVRETCPLVLAGGWGWNYHDLAAFWESEGRHKNVVHLGYLNENDLPAVYNGALGLVMPSLYEGFGLPIVEMLACGGAVVASTADALGEVLGGVGCTIDPRDRDTWRASLLRIMTDDDWRKALQRGARKRAEAFTWDRCAADTYMVFRQLMDSASNRKAA
jgi:alpha-1,3-rhamnosyl/mannosyltransferase